MTSSIIETLKRSELFIGLDDRDIQKIVDLPSCKAKTYEGEEIIFLTGEEANLLYVLEEGQVHLVLKLTDTSSQLPEQTEVATVTNGGTFGWSGLMPPYTRVMTAISKGPSKAISISGNELRTLFDKHPGLGYEVMKSLMRVIVSRIWNLEQLLTMGKRSPCI